MKWIAVRRLDRGVVALLITLSLILLLVISAWSWLWVTYRSDVQNLQDLNPRIARQLGVQQAKEVLDEQVNQVTADISLVAYPADKSANEVNAELQQRVRQLFEASGMKTQGTQSLPVVEKAGYQMVAIVLNAQGSMPSLTTALEKLTLEKPLIAVDRIVLQPVRSIKKGGVSEQVVRIELKASVVRLAK